MACFFKTARSVPAPLVGATRFTHPLVREGRGLPSLASLPPIARRETGVLPDALWRILDFKFLSRSAPPSK